jgi:small-conductance mechanosensitive channel/CRP-like cAMP-binding protein
LGHYPEHLILGVAALAVTLGIMSLTVNRLVKRKLRLSVFLLAIFVAINLLLIAAPSRFSATTAGQLGAFEKLALAAALINALVISFVNPLRADRVPDRFPVILQDAMVIGLVLLTSTFISNELITTSAVSAVVIGFALQDTLGNAFAGLAIQSEKPFHVGHWVRVGEFEGRVAEVTWRATKLRTKSGNFVIVPNNVVSKEAIINYSEPAAPTRLEVEVGASYLVAPNQVKAAILEAVRHCSRVLEAPAPDVVLISFDASAINYKARFWVEDYERDEAARDQVRTAIYYAFQRHNIDIPWPIQVQYERDLPGDDSDARLAQEEQLLSGVDLFATLTPALRHEVAMSAPMIVFGAGEAIVRQGEAGQSMFIVARGTVSVVLEPGRQEVARIETGGYFGEMSLLTGDPRSATVLAVDDVTTVEISADLFRRLAAVHPQAIEQIAIAAMTRRADLERIKTTTAGAVAVETNTLLARMKRFLRLS